MGNKTYDSSSKKKDFLPQNDQFWPKIGILVDLGQAMQAFSVPCWWVSWGLWRAGCIAQDTYLLYVNLAEQSKIADVQLFILNTISLLISSFQGGGLLVEWVHSIADPSLSFYKT